MEKIILFAPLIGSIIAGFGWRLIGEKAGLTAEDSYTLCSLAADLRVTQTVNGNKGIHCMLAKEHVEGVPMPQAAAQSMKGRRPR